MALWARIREQKRLPMKNKTQRGEAKKHAHKRSEAIQTSGKKEWKRIKIYDINEKLHVININKNSTSRFGLLPHQAAAAPTTANSLRVSMCKSGCKRT